MEFRIELLVAAQKRLSYREYESRVEEIESLNLEYTEQSRVLTPIVSRYSNNIFPTTIWRELQQTYATIKREGNNPLAEDELDFVSELFPESHLCTHDALGYFVPCCEKDGSLPILATDVCGGYVGSTAMLRKELLELVPVYQIELAPLKSSVLRRGGGFDVSPQCLDFLQKCVAADTKIVLNDPLYQQKALWFVLYEACRLSELHSSAIYLSHVEVMR